MMVYLVLLSDTVDHYGHSQKGGILGVFTEPELAEENIQQVLNNKYFQGNRSNFTIIPCVLDERYQW